VLIAHGAVVASTASRSIAGDTVGSDAITP
jgi:hypothetical protein